jgi:uncharacterized protein YjbI with pentapeptide repeats
MGLGLGSTTGGGDRRGGRRTSVVGSAIIGGALIGSGFIGSAVVGGAVLSGTIVGGAVLGGAVFSSTIVDSAIVGGAVISGAIVGGTDRHVRSLGCELGNSGTRELVGSVSESVDEDTGVAVLVGTREFDELVGAGGSGLSTTNLDLDTGGVELGASGLISQMKAENLVTEEISTASETGRELERMRLSVDCKKVR